MRLRNRNNGCGLRCGDAHFDAATLALTRSTFAKRIAVKYAVCVALAATLEHALPCGEFVWLIADAVVLANRLAGDVL